MKKMQFDLLPRRFLSLLLLKITIAATVGCALSPAPAPTLTTTTPTEPVASPTLAATNTPLPDPPVATLTPIPTEPATNEPAATSTLAPTVTAALPTAAPLVIEEYRVAFVEENDVLNVRAGPGVEHEIVGELAPGSGGVEITGQGEVVETSTWVPIEAAGVAGWVNSRFLTPAIDEARFCAAERAESLVGALRSAVENRDSAALARLVHAERGLRVRTSWWNPEVILSGEELTDIFSDRTAYDWGIADGSGLPIEGSFAEVILPLLEQDLLAADEITCNVLTHGSSAGLVILPASYEPVNYYAAFRPPGPDQPEMDWGTWTIGIEWWEGEFYISYLVHYKWEI